MSGWGAVVCTTLLPQVVLTWHKQYDYVEREYTSGCKAVHTSNAPASSVDIHGKISYKTWVINNHNVWVLINHTVWVVINHNVWL